LRLQKLLKKLPIKEEKIKINTYTLIWKIRYQK